jgi:uncharacterized protein (DUF697 family)
MTITQHQLDAVREITETCGYAAAALTILPIPGSELVAVMPLHVGMVVKIGQLYGVDLDRDSATHLIMRIGATVGLSLVGSRVATTAAKVLLPGLGGLISAPFMYASTIAIGRVAELYFQQGDLDASEMKAAYRETLDRAKRRFDPRRARTPEARAQAEAASRPSSAAPGAAPGEEAAPAADPVAQLERLARLRDAGAITPEEFEAAKRRVLAAI